MRRGLGRPGRRAEFFTPGAGWARSWPCRLESRPGRPASGCAGPSGLAHAGLAAPDHAVGLMEAGVPAASPGAPDGSRPEAHTLLHLVPSRLPVRLHGPKSPEPGQQALLPPLCGQPAWRGTWGPGQGAQHSEGGMLCISVGSRDRGPGRLSHAGLRPSRHAPLATLAPAVALPSEDSLKASQWPQRSPSLEVGTRLCP